jgi:hypothetical protein
VWFQNYATILVISADDVMKTWKSVALRAQEDRRILASRRFADLRLSCLRKNDPCIERVF